MNWIKRIFSKKINEKKCAIDSISCSNTNTEETQDDRLINIISELLKEYPEMFSAKWVTGSTIDNSIRSKDTRILIGLSGTIVSPVEPKMSSKQKDMIAKLIEPIVERDQKELIDKAISYYI
jgi:hypothetical protein